MGKQGVKTNHKKGIAAAAKQRRQEEALARQSEHDKLTTKQKLEKLESCGHKEGREYNRLIEKLATNQ